MELHFANQHERFFYYLYLTSNEKKKSSSSFLNCSLQFIPACTVAWKKVIF